MNEMHYAPAGTPGQPPSFLCGGQGMATSIKRAVTCRDCLTLLEPTREEWARRKWTVACVAGETELGFAEWMREVGVGPSTPSHKPPYMSDLGDGVFIFYGTHSDLGGTMEVVPMTTGNVEFTIPGDDDPHGGLTFNLSHLDRMDLVRALLHDFHYSPERGGPSDDD